jgi:dTDP-glucose pyrophosphorylase
MAGAGSRFSNVGYVKPKPLIPIHGIPMIRLIIENLRPSMPHRFIFICQRAHVKAYNLTEKLNAWAPNSIVVEIDGLTEGAACTVISAAEYIDNHQPLMIANSDQYIDININSYLSSMTDLDGLIMTMEANDPKWSFVELNEKNLVTRVVEKEVISNEATVGIYNFRYGKDFVNAANKMIDRNLRVNGEFYVAPVYNQLVEQNKRIGIFNIGSVGAGMYGLGTPDDLNKFLELPLSKIATDLT